MNACSRERWTDRKALKQIDRLSAERKRLEEELSEKSILHRKAGITVSWLQDSTNRSSYVAAAVDVYQHGYERGQEVSDMLFPRILKIWKGKLT